MEGFAGFCFAMFLTALFLFCTLRLDGCAQSVERERIIKEQGFCVKASADGQTFEKCYDVKARP